MTRWAGLALLGALALASLLGPGAPGQIDLDAVLLGPSLSHPLGTDHLGRDLAARVIAGSGPAVAAVLAALGGVVSLGLLGGAALSLGPAPVRSLVAGVADLVLAIPTLVVALILSAIMGGGALTVGLALALTAWAPYALTIAALSDRIRSEQFWLAARALGVPPAGGFMRHILPTLAAPLGALLGADAGRAVILAASLGFLGLGVDTGRPDWGAMIHEYRMFLFEAPRLLLVPMAVIGLLSLALHLVFDPVSSLAKR